MTRKVSHLILLMAILGMFAVLIVGWEELMDSRSSEMSVGMRHALLTARAAVVTAAAAGTVYLLMRRQQRRLAATAEQLARLLKSHQEDPSLKHRFENPHLVPCREAIGCTEAECPMDVSLKDRCWQVMALRRSNGDQQRPRLEIQECLECAVYRQSCPDRFTELGEAFNNLLFLLETEAAQARRMRAQMVERDKMAAIGQIAAGVAHEVGNPLSSISSIVQMLKRSGSRESTAEQLDLIDTHIQRITGIVRQMVSLARPSPEDWELIDLRQTLSAVARLVSFDRRARAVDVVLDCPPALPRTLGLRDQLQQVFLNLALNALDAMPVGGTLTIGARVRRRNIVVRVRDTGNGIEANTGRRVFEPFFTTKQPGQGTGLGLAVSYGIVQKHGGTIDFSSTVGQGTEFTVEIPILTQAPDGQHGPKHHSTSRR
jgi:signal transduction histidine kinase